LTAFFFITGIGSVSLYSVADRTNADWIAELRAGGQQQSQALEDLHRLLERTATFYVRRRLSGREGVAADAIQALVEDSSQEASVLILQRLNTFRGEAKFQTWASSFVIRIAMTALRRRLWQDVSLDRPLDPEGDALHATLPASGWADPQLAAQRGAIWDVVRNIMETDLTDRQRYVLNILVIQGMPTEVAEEHLNMTASALYKMTHDARKKLKAGLQSRGFTTEEVLEAFSAAG
jgi:RNA polymerase sigma-70 factor (ECF subfamily)